MKQSKILNRAYSFTLMMREKEERHGDFLALKRCERLDEELNELHEMILQAEREEENE